MTKSTAIPVVINGSHGEGGGALLRCALTVSCLTQQPVRVHNVRGSTRRAGLSSEDLTFLKILAQTCDAEVTGDELKGNDLTFAPTKAIKPVHARASVGEHEKGSVPGNALVILSSLLPVLARGGAYSKVIIEGETYNPNTITFDAFERVSLAMHRKQGLYAFPVQEWAGFGFAGYGEVGVEVEPSVFGGLQWEKRGNLREVHGVISFSEIPASTVERGVSTLDKICEQHGIQIDIEAREVPSKTPGIFVTLWAEFENGLGSGTAMGQRGIRMESIMNSAFENLLPWLKSDATVDPFLADQLLIPAAFAEEPSIFTTSNVTARLQTMAWVIKEFLPIHITILGREGEPGTIKISR